MLFNYLKQLGSVLALVFYSGVFASPDSFYEPEVRFVRYDSLKESGGLYKRSLADQKSNVPLFRQKALELHNFFRAMHGSPPLLLSQKLNEDAQKHAEHLASISKKRYTCDFVVCKDYFENIIAKNAAEWLHIIPLDEGAAFWATESWYNESIFYNYENPNTDEYKRWKDFAGLIWKSTEEMGIGIAYGNYISTETHNALDAVYVVARYFPKPYILTKNMLNSLLKSNVLPPKS